MVPSMVVGGLLQGLVSPAGGSHRLAALPRALRLLAPLAPLAPTPPPTHIRWLQASLRAAALLRCSSRGPLHRLLLHGAHAPPRRPSRLQEGYMFRRPSIGDIVFFKVPSVVQNYGVNKDVVFIKRVLATPGDFIEVRQGQLVVNGIALKEHYTTTHALYTREAMVCACISNL